MNETIIRKAVPYKVLQRTEYEASGEDYILTTEQNIAEQNGMRPSRVKGHYITFPEAGYTYDFRDATEPIWVCGKPYTTVVNGQSSPINVQGKRIRIRGVNKGDATEFARIWFRVEEST